MRSLSVRSWILFGLKKGGRRQESRDVRDLRHEAQQTITEEGGSEVQKFKMCPGASVVQN